MSNSQILNLDDDFRTFVTTVKRALADEWYSPMRDESSEKQTRSIAAQPMPSDMHGYEQHRVRMAMALTEIADAVRALMGEPVRCSVCGSPYACSLHPEGVAS